MKPVEIAFAIPLSILPGAQFGDAYQVIVEGQGARPFPNGLRVGPGALACLSPRAADIVRAAPRIPGWFDQPTYAIAPSAFGRPWTIGSRPLLLAGVCRSQRLDRGLARSAATVDCRARPARRWVPSGGAEKGARHARHEIPRSE